MKKLNKSVIAVLMLSVALFGCSSNGNGGDAEGSKGGTFSATEKGFAGDVTVNVTVDGDGKITDVTYTADDKTEALGQAAAAQLAEAMKEAGSAEVDAVSGSTVTSEAFIKAAKAAIEQAKQFMQQDS